MGDLVVAGGRPAPVCATNTVSAVVASMSCLGVLGLGRSFHLGGRTERFEVSCERWDRLECVDGGGFDAV